MTKKQQPEKWVFTRTGAGGSAAGKAPGRSGSGVSSAPRTGRPYRALGPVASASGAGRPPKDPDVIYLPFTDVADPPAPKPPQTPDVIYLPFTPLDASPTDMFPKRADMGASPASSAGRTARPTRAAGSASASSAAAAGAGASPASPPPASSAGRASRPTRAAGSASASSAAAVGAGASPASPSPASSAGRATRPTRAAGFASASSAAAAGATGTQQAAPTRDVSALIPQPGYSQPQSSAFTSGPSLSQLERELKKSEYRRGFGHVLRNTAFSLLVVAAVSAIIAVLLLPVLQMHGTSMTPTLQEQDIVVAFHNSNYKTGDLIAFYYNNNILVKRVIATAGDWVDIDADGNVSVNGVMLDEPYLSEKALGDCDIELPFQVPDARCFVMGDHRETSIDSRSTMVGCVSHDMIIGRIVLRVWPLEEIRFFGFD